MTMLVPLVIQFEAQDEGAHGVEIQIDDKFQRDVIWMYVRRKDASTAN